MNPWILSWPGRFVAVVVAEDRSRAMALCGKLAAEAGYREEDLTEAEADQEDVHLIALPSDEEAGAFLDLI